MLCVIYVRHPFGTSVNCCTEESIYSLQVTLGHSSSATHWYCVAANPLDRISRDLSMTR